MKTDTNTNMVLGSIVQTILPHGRKRYWNGLKKQNLRPLRLAMESTTMLFRAYREQAAAAFNWVAFAVQMAVTVFCFGTAALPADMAAILIAILGGLSFRDAYTYGKARDMASCGLRSATDAATTTLLLLAVQALIPFLEPKSALRSSELWSSAAMCLPLLSALRMAFAVQPDPNAPPFGGQKLSPAKLCRRIKWLNFLWMIIFVLVIALNTTDIPNYWPDRLRGFCPVFLFRFWYAIQRQPFGRFDFQTVFTDPEKSELRRLLANLAPGLEKGEPFYRLSLVLETGLHMMIGLALADAMLPWLTGHSPDATLLKAVAALFASSTSFLSWKFVKHSNRAVARALEAKLQRLG